MIRIVAAGAGAALVALLAADLQASERTQTLRSSPHFWTEGRLRDAVPMLLPEIDPSLIQQDALGLGDLRSSAPGVGESGVPPNEDIDDEFWQQLYEPDGEAAETPAEMLDDEDLEFEPLAQSPTGALYTQSRVFFPAVLMQHHPYTTIGKLFFRDPRTGNTFVCSGSVIHSVSSPLQVTASTTPKAAISSATSCSSRRSYGARHCSACGRRDMLWSPASG